MVGKIFITRSGYDPQLGKHVKDPYLGPNPTLGACRPDVRKQLQQGDHIFVISGKIPVAPQYVMGGFEIAAKIDPLTAYQQFPEQRLHRLPDGQLPETSSSVPMASSTNSTPTTSTTTIRSRSASRTT